MIKTSILLLFFFLTLPSGKCQTANCEFFHKNIFKKIYTSATSIPSPKNGVFEILNNVTQYYKVDVKSIQSSFDLELFINKNGKLKSANIHNKTKKMLSDEELQIIEIIKKTKNWYPAKCQGKEVDFLLRIPLKL